jgi:ribosome-associated toxin RatA of RatAB toxin-antitoxin module
MINEKSGKGGRGIVIQDIHASPVECMDRIKDLANYHKMVPKVNKVTIYEDITMANGTRQMKAEFNVGLSLLKFRYYLFLTHEPAYNTLTWTLDYRYNSDFDDTTGHWQVMAHPEKEGWSRVLYSTQVKLFPWVPEFVVTFLTKTALVEATTWVRKESEKLAALGTFKEETNKNIHTQPDLKPCFVTNEYGARYDIHCIHGVSTVDIEACNAGTGTCTANSNE